MGNQQPSTLVSACINAKLGDGTYWKHPDCKNYKLIWSSVNEDWILWKQENLLPPNLRGSVSRKDRKHDNCFPNAKPIFTMTSKVHPLITEWKGKTRVDALLHVGLRDLAIWFLDDGCLHHRKDAGSYRIILSIGGLQEEHIKNLVYQLFGSSNFGHVCLNNSRATQNNMSWVIPKPIAMQILHEARKFAPPSMQRKVQTPLW